MKFLKKYRLVILAPAAAALVAIWTLAQPAPPPTASLFPSGALLYLEAKDFGGLLSDWNSSAEKKSWLDSANYDSFSRSQLFLEAGGRANRVRDCRRSASRLCVDVLSGRYEFGFRDVRHRQVGISLRDAFTVVAGNQYAALENARHLSNAPCRQHRLLHQRR